MVESIHETFQKANNHHIKVKNVKTKLSQKIKTVNKGLAIVLIKGLAMELVLL